MNKFYLIAFAFFLVTNLAAQNDSLKHCGADEMRLKLLLDHPNYNSTILRREQQLEEFTKTFLHNTPRNTGSQYIIPVVFHVIHNFGIENIGDAQILDGLRVLNDYYNKNSADSTQIVPAFKSLSADCKIEFRLAKKDPNGNCTKGINRIPSYLTNVGDHQVKELIHWPADKYLNIYIVANAAGLAGHCLWPADADTLPEWDGIVIAHDYVGSFGTATPTKQVTLSHEVGHYFNLQHTWGGNNVPGFYFLPCADPNKDCSIDDGVSDTPTTIGWKTCTLNGSSCGSSIDNVQNMMEYSFCNRMFTPGQVARMHACLNAPVAHRNNLWSVSNLLATGVDTTPTLCRAEFANSLPLICEGGTVTFTEESYNGTITARNWYFPGGTPSYSNSATVTVTYPATGIYGVKLVSYSNLDSVVKTIDSLVFVTPSTTILTDYFENFESITSLPNSGYLVNNPDLKETWKLYNANGTVRLHNFNNDLKAKDELILPVFNLQGQTNKTIYFKYAFARKQSNNSDKVVISVSKDCGKTWSARLTKVGAYLATKADTVDTDWTPGSNEWGTLSLNIPTGYYVNNLKVKLTFENDGGNNFYIDEINVSTPTNILEINPETVQLTPNPANQIIQIRSEEVSILSVKIIDLSGRIAKRINVENLKNISLTVNDLQTGLYLVELQLGNGQHIQKKISVQK